MPIIKFKRLTETAVIPKYAHDGDVGMDICADEDIVIEHGQKARISSGIAAEIPDGYEIQVRPRSGLSSRGVIAMFATVDTGYCREIGLVIYNFSGKLLDIRKGDRISQLVIAPVTRAEIVDVDEIDTNTERGTSGFGSTGL